MTWERMVPELAVSDFEASLQFYRDVLGFTVLFMRDTPKFAYMEFEGAQLMIEALDAAWQTGPFEHPFGGNNIPGGSHG